MAGMRHFEDFQVGDKIVTRGRTITEADVVMFAAFTGDWHPLHTDVEYARQGPFQERIAHGFLVLSVASGLLPLSEMAIIAFYGIDKLRFVAPVKLLDTIRVEMEVMDKQERDERGGVITFRQTIRNQRGEDVAVGTMRSFIARRKQGEPQCGAGPEVCLAVPAAAVAKPIVEDGMENETILEVREKDGLLIHQGVIRVPYTWAAGAVASKFYAGLRDRRICGIRCPACRLVMVPPKKTCHRCFGDLDDWVEVGPEGTLQTFTVVHYSEPELHPLQSPLAYGIIKLDGADTGMTHLIAEADLRALKEGMRMTAVFREKPEGNYLDIRYFKPVKGAK